VTKKNVAMKKMKMWLLQLKLWSAEIQVRNRERAIETLNKRLSVCRADLISVLRISIKNRSTSAI
jgi:hypothetical protein